MTYYFGVVQIHYRGEIHFFVADAEFGDVGREFFVRFLCREIPAVYIWRNPADLSFIGAVFPFAAFAFESERIHEFEHCLVVYDVAEIAQRVTDPSIAVTASVFAKYIAYFRFFVQIFVGAVEPFQVIIISASRKVCKREKIFERISMPQLRDYERFCAFLFPTSR